MSFQNHESMPTYGVASSSPDAGTRSGQTGERTAAASATQTITEQPQAGPQEVLRLTLRNPPSVTWDETVVDNEGVGRKSSKRCCIFHKQRDFGESSTDSSEYDSDHSESSADSESGADTHGKAKMPRKIARPKKTRKVPDYQRYHA